MIQFLSSFLRDFAPAKQGGYRFGWESMRLFVTRALLVDLVTRRFRDSGNENDVAVILSLTSSTN